MADEWSYLWPLLKMGSQFMMSVIACMECVARVLKKYINYNVVMSLFLLDNLINRQ